MSYIYLITNKDWDYESKYKYGYTSNPINRIADSHEQHSHKSSYLQLYKIEKTDDYILHYKQYDKIIYKLGTNDIKYIKDNYDIELHYFKDITKYLVNDEGSTEFIYKNGLEIFENILLKEFPLLGLKVKLISIDEIDKINLEITRKINEKKKYEKTINPFNYDKKVFNKDNNQRDYQSNIISYCINSLNKFDKIYLELATGGGKTYIVYNILKVIKPKVIIIFSPLKIIKNQNIGNKYKKILDITYEIYDKCPDKFKDEYMIISCCTNSHNNIYDYIINNKIKEVCIWFDESHWAFEEWCNTVEDDIKKFLLEDTTYISKRIFTSASPNKKIILKNQKIFGELYSPIKVSKLIDDKWLCPIEPYVFSINRKDPDIIYYNLKGFTELNKKYGFSFHSNCDNAFNLFYKHYELYKKNETDIKPFLLLRDSYKEPNEIILDYDYKDFKKFEENPNNISYVVRRFSMGYDFNKIDMIFISDPKTSYKDIIQTIGRGTRSDCLGEEGKNLYKKLAVLLPVFIEEGTKNELYDIIEVLKYLILDVELEFEDIIKNKIPKINKNNKNKEYDENIYIGTEEIHGIMYNILKDEMLWNLKKLTLQLIKNDIHNLNDYKEYCKNNKILNLPEVLYKTFPEFTWIETYKDGENPYYSKKECIEVLKNIDISYIDDDEEIIEYLNKIDNKIPLECLWRFYGGNKSDYF